MKVIILTPDGKIVNKTIKNSLDGLQSAVGGFIQYFPHKGEQPYDIVCYVNAEGLLEGLPANWFAWGVLKKLGFYVSNDFPVSGNAILVNSDEEKSLTKEMVNRINDAVNKEFK